MTRRLSHLALAVLCLATVPAAPALAASYPSQPITIVVPFPAGGPTDNSARLLAKAMADDLGQPVVIENRAGAGGTIGSAYVARAKPDGYTLLWGGTSSLAVAPALYSSLPYEPTRSFVPVGMAVRSPLILAGKSALSASTVPQLLAEARTRQLSYGSAGNGSIGHLAGELFKDTQQVNLLHVPYKGGAPALTDLLGGQIDLMFDTVQFLLPQVKAGKIKAFAITGKTRYAPLPDVPTMSEATGKPFEAYSWFGLVAPAATGPDVVRRLTQALHKAAQDPAVVKQLAASGLEPVGGSGDEFGAAIRTDLKRWTDIVKAAGVKVE